MAPRGLNSPPVEPQGCIECQHEWDSLEDPTGPQVVGVPQHVFAIHRDQGGHTQADGPGTGGNDVESLLQSVVQSGNRAVVYGAVKGRRSSRDTTARSVRPPLDTKSAWSSSQLFTESPLIRPLGIRAANSTTSGQFQGLGPFAAQWSRPRSGRPDPRR